MQKHDSIRKDKGVHMNVHAFLFIIVAIIIAAGMAVLNHYTPLQMDDYDYSFSWSTGRPLNGLMDILKSQIVHYRLWGGRSITHFLTQFFLYLGKPVFNVLNTAAYLCLLAECLFLSLKPLRSFSWEMMLLFHLLLFFTVPFFGVVFLWLDGACNYLWGTLMALWPLLITRSRMHGGLFARRAFFPAAMLLVFISGWTNENTACGILAAEGLIFLETRIREKRLDIPGLILILCETAGVLLMLLAPGNGARASKYESGALIPELCRRLVYAVFYSVRFSFVPWVILAATIVFRKNARVLSFIGHPCLTAALFSVLALVGSPEVSDRTYLGVIVLLLTEAATWWDIRIFEKGRFSATIAAFTGFLLVSVIGFTAAAGAVRAHHDAWQIQLASIQAAADRGEERVCVSGIPSKSPYTMSITIERSPEDWPNSTLGKWFGIAISGE